MTKSECRKAIRLLRVVHSDFGNWGFFGSFGIGHLKFVGGQLQCIRELSAPGSGRMPGIAPRHPPTPPDVRFARIRRLNAASIFMGKQDLMASRIHSAATPRCSALSASWDWLQCATLPWNCAPPSAGVRSGPSSAACAVVHASCPTAAKSNSECVAVSSPPIRRGSGVPRPDGNIPTSLGRKRASGPAVQHWFDSDSFAITPGLSF